MKSFTIASVLTLAASSLTAAQNYTQSAPFNLVIISSNSTLNGSALVSCHEGAAIEGLCAPTTRGLANAAGSLYQFNTTDNGITPNETIGQTGVLTYELRGSNFNVSEPMILQYSPTTNVAVPLFIPGYDSTQVAFDGTGKLNIQSYINDTAVPMTLGNVTAYYQWAVCTTYAGYSYDTLAWIVGKGVAQNPTCQTVDVVRVFV